VNLRRSSVVHRSVFETSTTLARVDRQLAAAAGAQIALLAVLATQLGLGLLGWLAGAAYALGLRSLLGGAARRAGATTLGPADVVTLARAALVGGVTALVVDRLGTGAIPVATLVVLASVALFLDAVDGKVARHTGTASPLGARFDMEVDAFLVLVLSVQAAVFVTPWALAIGGMRYAFVVTSWTMPWLSGSLPTRYSAKVVAALQGIVLVVACAGVLPLPVAATLVVAALGALTWSFAQSVAWLWRVRAVNGSAVFAPAPAR
jgi:phosphatidylglycerophosphate synthase